MGKPKKIWLVVLWLVLMIMVIVWLGVVNMDFSRQGEEVKFGVSFSHKYASQELGLDWTEVYWAIIHELEVKDIRLAVPWDLIEERNNHYNFTDIEWMVEEAAKKEVNIILAIGRRTPRWPECHDPGWIGEVDKEEQDRELLEMVERVVKYFRGYENIVAWQVENEPLLDLFGECPKADRELLTREVELVRGLDSRPIMITDTGELSSWDEAAALGDIFGATMYKTVWNKFIGVWRYPWPPAYYHYKMQRIDKKYELDKIIVSELQAEPWTVGEENITEMSELDQMHLFGLSDLEDNLAYVRQAGFSEAYLWGVEWWYWLAKEEGNDKFWQRAKLIWQD